MYKYIICIIYVYVKYIIYIIYIYIYIYISKHNQNTQNHGNRASTIKQLLETVFVAIKHKDVH